MPTGYRIDHQDGYYFLTLRVVEWVDVFSRKIYAELVLESLDFCRKEKGLKLWAYVIMTNHLHLIVSADNNNLSDVVRDFKRYTATSILKAIQELSMKVEKTGCLIYSSSQLKSIKEIVGINSGTMTIML